MSNVFRYSHQIVLIALAAYWLLIAVGTHVPSHQVGVDILNDKVLHFGAFAGLAFLLSMSVIGKKAPSWRLAFGLIAITLAYGAIDEITQGWVPTREPDWRDWVADSLGAAAGFVAYVSTLSVFRSRRFERLRAWTSNSIPMNDAA